ncbi:MAG: HAD family hydrolase [FCB group bacterium]|jgi:phosphoglycolate phosphatase-like HAD superfamily hydrolase
MTIFFDLDGPILDVSEKYYRIYADLLQSKNYETLAKSRYWELKRNKTPDREILGLTGAEQIRDWYKAERKSLIESDAYMKYDSVQHAALNVLEKLSSENTLFLVTLRNSYEQLQKELELFDIKKYFRSVLTAVEEKYPRWKLKYDLVNNYFAGKLPQESFFIGDTETDIMAGKALGCKTIAVANGIRDVKILEDTKPDFIVISVKEILSYI